VIRPRFLFQEVMTGAEVVTALDRIRRRGSQGICLKARDLPAVRAAVDRLAAAGIPVFTLVTDLPGSARAGYIGLDNMGAGRTAAHLVAHGLQGRGGRVLTVRSQDAFAGEADRLAGFRATLAALRPGTTIRDVAGGAGLPADTARRVAADLAAHGPVDAVYSIGGGNAAILAALDAHGLGAVPFIAHDLDRENRALLQAGRIAFVLHHDLVADMRELCLAVMAAHRLAPERPPAFSSDVHVVGPYNIPSFPR
jgi:LacI family transcriptional regulator